MANENQVMVQLEPPDVMRRLAATIADERTALLHRSQVKGFAFMGKVQGYGFRMLPIGSGATHPVVCRGSVDWTGSASRINLSFNGRWFAAVLVVSIFMVFSVVAIVSAAIAVFAIGDPPEALVITTVVSILVLALAVGIGALIRWSKISQEKRLRAFLDSVFHDVRVSA
jgi:hypothetical protein